MLSVMCFTLLVVEIVVKYLPRLVSKDGFASFESVMVLARSFDVLVKKPVLTTIL